MNTATEAALLQIKQVQIGFGSGRSTAAPIVRGVSLDVARGEIVGLVGESGSGKSLTCRTVLDLLPEGGRVLDGRVMFEGQDVLGFSRQELHEFRRHRVGMIFQDPFSSLNPTRRIGSQMIEALRASRALSDRQARDEAVTLLEQVDIPEPVLKLRLYPHELSGGMRQRVMLALAMSARPKLLIADEPTTALDTTTQAQILRLLRRIRDEQGTSILLVSHDFGVIAEMCDRVAVMYGGFIVETGPVEEVYLRPRHPYTRALIAAVPTLEVPPEGYRRPTIDGPPLGTSPYTGGCPFAPRCPLATDACLEVSMTLSSVDDRHSTACPF